MLRTLYTNLAAHDADALVFGNPEDFSPQVLDALKKRYPGLMAQYGKLQGVEKWVPGTLNFFGKPKPEVIFVNIKDPETGVPSYRIIRDVFRKLTTEAKDRGLKRLACGALGCGRLNAADNHVTIDAIEVVIPAAISDLDSKLEIDLYRS